MIGIYKITCLVNGMIYIGQSKDIEIRWKSHIKYFKRNKNSHLIQTHYNLYGIESFVFEVVEECSIQDLKLREAYWIKQIGTYNVAGTDKFSKVMKGKNKICLEMFKEEIISLWKMGTPTKAIGQLYQVDPKTIHRRLEEWSIKPKTRI